MRKTFRNARFEEKLEEDGYVKLHLLSDDDLCEIREGFKALHRSSDFSPNGGEVFKGDFYTSSFSKDREYKRAIHNLALQVFSPHLERVFYDYEILMEGFFVKTPGKGNLPLHQDPSLTSNENSRNVIVWCPLIDVDKNNGTLFVVPGSHRIIPRINTFMSLPYYWAYATALTDKYARSISVSAGEVLVFDTNLLHGSPNNMSNSLRSSFQLYCFPKEKQKIFYFINPGTPNQLEAFEIQNPDFFIDNDLLEEVVRGATSLKRLGIVRYDVHDFSLKDFEKAIESGEPIFPEYEILG
jgi:hypothetical protein